MKAIYELKKNFFISNMPFGSKNWEREWEQQKVLSPETKNYISKLLLNLKNRGELNQAQEDTINCVLSLLDPES